MNSKLSGLLATCVLIPGIIASALPVKPAWAGGAYGADTCRSGYVWREVVRGDRVCVTPRTRSQTAYDNSQAAIRRNPGGGAYGADTCRSGYVWREAVRGDRVCVTPRTRSQAAYDNSQASARRQSGSVPIDPGTNLNPVRD